MEWKIGEIKQVNGEWYQCIRSSDCPKCDLKSIKDCRLKFPCEPLQRNDCEEVIFKKLEKVGEPVTERGRTFQRLNAFKTECTGCVFLNRERGCDKDHYIDGPCFNREIWVEIKQNKEDMEEKKIQHYDCFFDREPSKSNLKPFDLEAAKAGKPVCTRDGRKARIICFNDKTLCDYPIIALVENADNSIYEAAYSFSDKGEYLRGNIRNIDLVMPLEEHEG